MRKIRLPKIKLNKNIVFSVVIVSLFVFEVAWFLSSGERINSFFSYFYRETPAPSGIILFEGTDCENCTKVDTFIKNNEVESKIPFTRLEVFGNPTNANILSDKAQKCGLDQGQLGVPFLWDGTHCIIGYIDVIRFFQDKLNVKKP